MGEGRIGGGGEGSLCSDLHTCGATSANVKAYSYTLYHFLSGTCTTQEVRTQLAAAEALATEVGRQDATSSHVSEDAAIALRAQLSIVQVRLMPQILNL